MPPTSSPSTRMSRRSPSSSHLGEERLRDQRLSPRRGQRLEERIEVRVVRTQPENPLAPVSIERLDDDVAVPGAEFRERRRRPRDQGRRRQVPELRDQQFLGRVADPEGVVHDQGRIARMLEDVGRGHVVHVEGRVLAQKDHVELVERRGPRRVERAVVALGRPDGDLPRRRERSVPATSRGPRARSSGARSRAPALRASAGTCCPHGCRPLREGPSARRRGAAWGDGPEDGAAKRISPGSPGGRRRPRAARRWSSAGRQGACPGRPRRGQCRLRRPNR